MPQRTRARREPATRVPDGTRRFHRFPRPARGSRAPPRSRPTCAPGSETAADRRAARRTGRAVSRVRNSQESSLELAEDAFGRVLVHGRGSGAAQPLAKPFVGEVAPNRLTSAAVSPAGTSRPFTPSWTTSETPPASIASTGVPTASASTTVCGKFSQLDDRIVASAAWKSSMIALARLCADERHAVADSQLAGSRLERFALGALAGDHELHSARACDRLERAAERLLRRQTPGEGERRAVQAESSAKLFPLTELAAGRALGSGERSHVRLPRPTSVRARADTRLE